MPDEADKYVKNVAEETGRVAPGAYPPPQQPFQLPEQQDLGLAKLARPDRAWARTQPIQMTPSKERLDMPHQIVNVKNTSDTEVSATGRPKPQVHIVIDRFMVGHELQPGQTLKDVDMLVHDIEYFNRERSSDRHDIFGYPKPRHPIEINGYKPDKIESEKVEKRTRVA